MTDTDTSTVPLAFAASFPPEERFAATAAEIASRLAASAGCAAEAAEDIRSAVDAAFREALAAGGQTIDLTLTTTNGAFDADLARGSVPVLHCSRARSA